MAGVLNPRTLWRHPSDERLDGQDEGRRQVQLNGKTLLLSAFDDPVTRSPR
jgi:hypothetical protein